MHANFLRSTLEHTRVVVRHTTEARDARKDIVRIEEEGVDEKRTNRRTTILYEKSIFGNNSGYRACVCVCVSVAIFGFNKPYFSLVSFARNERNENARPPRIERRGLYTIHSPTIL